MIIRERTYIIVQAKHNLHFILMIGKFKDEGTDLSLLCKILIYEPSYKSKINK